MATTDAERLGGPEELDDDERAAVEALLLRLADDELVLAERYTEWQVRAPTLESDLAISNVAQDELGHARLWYDLLAEFGRSEVELLFERDPAEFRHSTLVEQPFAEGDWADAVVRGYLYDVAEHLRLEALADSAYRKIADRVGKVLGEEEYHREHARNWLERLADDDAGRERVQAAVDRLFPYALTLFEPGERDAEMDALGLRTESLADLRERWLDEVTAFLHELDVRPPLDADDEVEASLPDAVGRDGTHDPAWPELHDEMTETYRKLGRDSAHRILPPTDDE